MMRCKNCGWLRWVTTTNTSYYCEFDCGKFLGDLSDCCKAWKPIPQTNADRIRSMTDEELANWFAIISSSKPQSSPEWLEWLKEEVKE